eukprot:CAMPEP_0196584206 /NCGR_PEP_ID=MMETSP1081-20130531/46178_1 /TAXON_ID=36882 /ORGANISM="Pyramimonas amylifera, Strain CCMP720" /LENGTH=882 /DNA_ID=CAMNT_0041905339 /DNA_START=243 /DNA_END=2891 /DNA_ORIENTATION=-
MASSTEAKGAPVEIFRKDYTPYDFSISSLDLDFNLGEEVSVVASKMSMVPNFSGETKPLILDGSSYLDLKSVIINGAPLSTEEFSVDSKKKLMIPAPPSEPFTLEIVVHLQPQLNTSLDGLYKSSGNFCTQCESHGFENITFFPDRPDVLTVYTTRISADKEKYPVLLGNGNLTDSGDLEDGRHFALWSDPFPKPCYLFALVAGRLSKITDSFTTASGKPVELRIYTEEHNVHKCEHAMKSLILSMKWDEDVYGLEYDLELFNIVAVDDFNMGAMENKSLNIFNSKLVLALPETATDSDYAAIEGVVAHEYFHNWTGNRVTCRDWFQLSLKEGLTVFRDQEFSADVGNRGVKRIEDVVMLRAAQFAEDSSPMAHPIRPDSYINMNNFYTVTVYEKGAEVVRMYQTLLGREGFRKGMDLYFQRHNGQAVSCDDFLSAMEDANSTSLGSFKLWYSQAGTPALNVEGSYDPSAQTFTLKCSQTVPPTPGQNEKAPMLLPVAVGLLGPDGKDMPLCMAGKDLGTTTVLRMEQSEQCFVFEKVAAKPTLSVLRNFSAPVKLTTNNTPEDLRFLLANDSDEFNRWEAGQQLATRLLVSLYHDHQEGKELVMDDGLIDSFRKVLTDPSLDPSFVAMALSLPMESELVEMFEHADPDSVHEVRQFVLKKLSAGLKSELSAALVANSASEYKNDYTSCAARSLKNLALAYLVKLDDDEITAEAVQRYKSADNMTDQIAALSAVAGLDCPQRQELLGAFHDQWKDDPLVMNKWLSLQARSNLPGNTENVRQLLEHPAFDMKNPNKVYSLLGGYCSSIVNFHNKDGSGYTLLGDLVVTLDAINPQVAARMVKPFTRWRKFNKERQTLMQAELDKILASETISENTYEIASKSK